MRPKHQVGDAIRPAERERDIAAAIPISLELGLLHLLEGQIQVDGQGHPETHDDTPVR